MGRYPLVLAFAYEGKLDFLRFTKVAPKAPTRLFLIDVIVKT
jgi:hypothetical protein